MQAGSRAAIEVFSAFLRLGLRSFGGPVAHLGYFRDEFVTRRGWLGERAFAQLLALCQFLPGPASSQLGFAIGLRHAGVAGALCAWLAFTAPSALLMYAFARSATAFGGAFGAALLHGLKLVAVAVVGAALLAMARTLARGARRIAIALLAAALVVALDAAWAQLAAIAVGAVAGALLCRDATLPVREAAAAPVGRRAALACGLLYVLALAAVLARPLLWPAAAPLAQLVAATWQAGALVFGGGHVVLPLLQATLVEPGHVTAAQFLAGYGAAQAVPGPMFSFAAYLGAVMQTGAPPALAATLALLAMFTPGLLLLVAALPAWNALGSMPRAAAPIAGVDAAVVGLLAAAFVDPVCSQGLGDVLDAAIGLAGFAALAWLRWPALAVVAGCVAAALLRAALGA